MERHLALKMSIFSITAWIFLIIFPFSAAQAAAGCCSHHGGVKGCNSANNHLLCKDGTTSPTCLCGGGKTKASQPNKTANPSTTNTVNVPAAPAPATTAPTPSTPTTAAPTTGTTSAATKAKTKGCCAKHGGVASCNTATGFQKCKDGTDSTTCKC